MKKTYILLKKAIKKNKQFLKPVVLFLIYTLSITWSCWLFIIVANTYFNTLSYGEPLTWLPYTIGSLGPAISSYIVYRQFMKNRGSVSFMQFVFGNKINSKVWLIFGLFLIWRFLTIWIAFEVQKSISVLFILSLFINLLFVIFLGGAEELGWRGILQPRLETMFGYIPSVLIVGVIWSGWHLPLWFMNGTIQSKLPFNLYLASGIVLSASFTTFYKYTQNLFLTVVSHAWFNVCIGLTLHAGQNDVLQLDLNWKVVIVFGLEGIAALILGAVYSHKKSENVRLWKL